MNQGSIYLQRKTAGYEPAGIEVSLTSDFAQRIINGQVKSGYLLEISHPENEGDSLPALVIGASNAARSLLILYGIKKGVTRAEALGSYFVLSLTQHVFKIRRGWELEVETERIAPTGYARYHLLSPVSIRIFNMKGL